jgi:hypothetical protein
MSPADDAATLGMSSVYRLFEAFIAMREKNERQHKMFEQTLKSARDALQSSFNAFAGDTQIWRSNSTTSSRRGRGSIGTATKSTPLIAT